MWKIFAPIGVRAFPQLLIQLWSTHVLWFTITMMNSVLLLYLLWFVPPRVFIALCLGTFTFTKHSPFSLSSLLYPLTYSMNCSRKFTHTDPGYDRVGKIGKDGSPMTILDIARQGDQAFEGPVTYSFCVTCEVCI